MIDPRELRIGNKFHMIGSKMVNTVFDISDNTRRGKVNVENENQRRGYSHLITVEENGNQYKPFEMDGIPLTSEWLERFGSIERFGFFTAQSLAILVSGEQAILYNKLSGNISVESAQENQHMELHSTNIFYQHIKYVHQLQNLYFALTGKELELKKP